MGALAKAAIATILSRYEYKYQPPNFTDNDDWLGYLFESMVAGVHSIDRFASTNQVSFISFNYDRFLESWLLHALKYTYRMPEEETRGAFAVVPIVHMYGSLGSFPFVPRQLEVAGLKSAVDGIKTIYEIAGVDTIREPAIRLINEAESIYLLGFGFHPENIQLLNLASLNLNNGTKRMASSRFGLTDGEWRQLTDFQMYGNIVQTNRDDFKCQET